MRQMVKQEDGTWASLDVATEESIVEKPKFPSRRKKKAKE